VIENRDELLAISLSLATDLQIGNLRPVDRRS